MFRWEFEICVLCRFSLSLFFFKESLLRDLWDRFDSARSYAVSLLSEFREGGATTLNQREWKFALP